MEQDQSPFLHLYDNCGDTFESYSFTVPLAAVEHIPFGHGGPWNPFHPNRDSTERDYAVGRVGEVFSETAPGSSDSSPKSSPRLYGVDVEHLHHTGLGFNALSKLNEPALIQHQQQVAPRSTFRSIATESECQRTESDYQVTNSMLSTDGNGYVRVRHPRSPRQQSRWEPYQRNRRYPSPTITSKGDYYVHSDFDVSSIVSPNDVETHSTYSHADYLNTVNNNYRCKTSESLFETGSINPQLTLGTISVTQQQYCPSLSSIQVGTGDSVPTTAPEFCPQIVDEGPYSPSSDENDFDMPMTDSSDEELEGKSGRDSKKGALIKNDLKRECSKKDKKRNPRGYNKGVQKIGEGKGDKSIRAKKAKERYMCKHHCPKVFSNASELRKHMQVKHERPFKCTFCFAGCDQSFGSKNEWKRHVTSQHMNLSYWECRLSSCKDRHAFFNRKDLFGQHLKRMHVPQGEKIENNTSDAQKKDIQDKNREERDRWIREEVPKIQGLCHKVLKEPPLESNCEICRSKFSGPKSWDAKMEHVGKHYESGESPPPGGPFEDEGLIKWALKYNLVEERVPYEDSSPNTSDGEYDEKEDPFSGISSSVHKIIMEDRRKYRFTKVNHFGPRIERSSVKPAEKLVTHTSMEALEPRFEDYSSGESLMVSTFFDGAYEGPSDHDTTLLLSGPRVIT